MKKCLVVVNSFKTASVPLSHEVMAFLKERGVCAESFIYDGNNAVSESVAVDFNGYDFVITLGGDGTVLFACRGCAPLKIPVFPVNLGEFGFLAGIQKECWKKELSDYLGGKSSTSERGLVECEVLRGGRSVFSNLSMNDCVISSAATSRLINLSVAYNRSLLGPFKANGIIVATPTGSTAYSAAAGGPIIDPAIDAMVLTPISSFSLSARPLVFGPRGEITITVLPGRSDVVLSCDGQVSFDLCEGDVLILSISEYKVRLLGASQERFYSALRSKLNWSGGPRA